MPLLLLNDLQTVLMVVSMQVAKAIAITVTATVEIVATMSTVGKVAAEACLGVQVGKLSPVPMRQTIDNLTL